MRTSRKRSPLSSPRNLWSSLSNLPPPSGPPTTVKKKAIKSTSTLPFTAISTKKKTPKFLLYRLASKLVSQPKYWAFLQWVRVVKIGCMNSKENDTVSSLSLPTAASKLVVAKQNKKGGRKLFSTPPPPKCKPPQGATARGISLPVPQSICSGEFFRVRLQLGAFENLGIRLGQLQKFGVVTVTAILSSQTVTTEKESSTGFERKDRDKDEKSIYIDVAFAPEKIPLRGARVGDICWLIVSSHNVCYRLGREARNLEALHEFLHTARRPLDVIFYRPSFAWTQLQFHQK